MASAKAWYWVAAGVLALGLNSEYQSGRLAWAHRAVDRSMALMERASDNGLRYVALAEIMLGHRQAEFGPAQVALARVQTKVACARMALAQREIEKARPQLVKARFESEKAHLIAVTRNRVALVTCPHQSEVRVRVPSITVDIPEPPTFDSPESAEADADDTF
ncbi:MAG: hypothetical protein DMG73_06120 [Acidobacteria bacterium]|nr:MAG: hypothetical protein DMG73_06120 [Acidobacteriota bacterium]PYX64255.1 MAG: hypothetical protein DMG74_13585 [Acidobacteriota bacterium]